MDHSEYRRLQLDCILRSTLIFSILFILYFIKSAMFLTRKEKEKMVIDFSHQGMGTREIARELRMSFSSIGAILRKESQQMETYTRASEDDIGVDTSLYALFASGKSSLEVAIELGLEADEAIRHQKEFVETNTT